MSNDRTTKNDILLSLLKRDSGVYLSDAVEQAKTMFYKLHDEYEELEDLRSGPQNLDLNRALSKVGFELKNDRTLASQIRQLFFSVAYDRLRKSLKVDPDDQEEQRLLGLSDDLAKEMIDTFISISEYRNMEID